MNNKKFVNVVIWLNVLFIILAICTEVFIFIYEEFNLLNIIYGCIDIVLLVEAFLYLVTGRKKSSAGYYKMFSILYAVRLFIGAAFSGNMMAAVQTQNVPASTTVAANVLTVIPLAPATMLATCKDLGKKKSFILVSVVYAIYMIEFLITVTRPFGYITHLDPKALLYFARPGLLALLTSLLGIMVIEKYQDKASRNKD